MKEPMKCERVNYEWETQEIVEGNKEENTITVKTNKHKRFCGGELEEKGKLQTGETVITETNVYYPTETTIYQCKSCKDVVIK